MKKPLDQVSPPSFSEQLTLRLMILLGTASMGYMLCCLFNRAQIGYAPFYWILMAGITFTCLRILHEWYHYFSIFIPSVPKQQYPFTVDIFTTFCPGEPYEMIVETLTAIQAIRYPHTSYLCDEANDPYLIEVCARLGVRHVTRNNRKDAKAGNINNALQYATGELCVILDPDHVPSPDFLDPIVSHFNDPTVGFVQIVQSYSNRGASLVAKGAAQQTFQFYGPIMATMNSYGTVMAIGANCTFRRAALDSIGGHASGLAEDMHTAMQLHAKKWRSVYVPAVLARGLVPTSMSAYYAQQLKWARGTFELLVTAYPALFRHFTWRQRLHYFTIPFHYFSGVVLLINFLIPVLSLFFGIIPFHLDILDFVLLGLPVVASIVLIRHFVQRWVMEEEERGFHVAGGLLFIGTWWIYILALFYTIIRKKVPYIPTPKDDSAPDNWKLNIPNILVLLASLSAILYGLYYDWNPYTLIMAAIASVNCGIMLFNIIASYKPGRLQRHDWIKTILIYPLLLKKKFWLFRHLHLYAGFRKLGLPLLIAAGCITFFLLNSDTEPSFKAHDQTTRKPVFYNGIFSPDTSDGLTSMQGVKHFQQQYNAHFNIVSLYIPWGNAPHCYLPDTLIKNIYKNGSLPMITWEPWASLFKAPAREQKIFSQISAGMFDDYLLQFANQVKALHRPLYLRFAHEADNPAYPWSPSGNNTPEEFKAAWKYVHQFFTRNDVNNVIWVWNPWSPSAAAAYFPGYAYVDWIGVNMLNYGPQREDTKWLSFKSLYTPFHQLPVFQSGLPVMVSEMGSLVNAGNQEQWLKEAFNAIRQDFREIHAAVLFNSAYDKNVLRPGIDTLLNWKVQQPQLLSFWKTDEEQYALLPEIKRTASSTLKMPDTIKGVGYHKGEQWFRNLHTLTSREITSDIEEMKSLGINTILRYGPGVYDRNILNIARKKGMRIQYGFWVPDITDMESDRKKLSGLEAAILQRISELKNNPDIIAWNIGNPNFQQLARLYYKPALLYQQDAYIKWLQGLVAAIKQIDPGRPVTVDVRLAENIAATLHFMHTALPEADAFGIIANDDSLQLQQLHNISQPYFFNQLSVAQYVKGQYTGRPVFITNWQDQESRDHVTFDGLKDHWGRFKPAFYELGGTVPAAELPRIKILRPAQATYVNARLTYHALVYRHHEWALTNERERIKFEWHLVKGDGKGRLVFLKSLGTGPYITLSIPENPALYRLYLQAINGNNVTTALSPLNTPL
ncbi:glycosyltransferase family 2 protein [Chitinophaga niabensis]|uniref:Glycosyltransferase, catalytic subunit of cellulose synthase and poly-beta-1,6-N-acetylglucosamine synthase n=1 Tax=Chitinophaga niabensis TaxID=536979 RepID=A0A1N6K0K8_9BACT|nr:glycosyltransferase family 2 protein [Chitinophaga niabensis]SIO50041.1 Glycosyltransferase, catalytic subunit of cellulose synthase and poly-beta-1,6-N-acetylglucosamine synthase [Chitinophaga niabensis]